MASSFSSKLACDLIDFAAQHGANADALHGILQLDKQYRNRDDVRVPVTVMARLWQQAQVQTNDPHLAFHMGAEFSYTARRTPSLIMQSSKSVLEAFELGIQYSEIIATALGMELAADNENFYLDFMPQSDWQKAPPSVVADSIAVTLVSCLNSTQLCVGKFVSPSILKFQFRRPDNAYEFFDIFNAEIEFNQPVNRIGFPKDVSGYAISTHDNGLLASLKKYGDELKLALDGKDRFVLTVQEKIIEAFKPPQFPSLDHTASALNMTSRTLQRKLSAADYSYQKLLDEIRQNFALKYLDGGQKTVFEISYLLGYRDISSFTRACKRWFGASPRQLGPH